MTERRFDMPTAPQRQAADPSASAWVGANAGSGKTRVLTQRVARLLLAGAEPEKILCLTYTKAAAAEMQTRLFATLGAWAMRPDDLLAAELGALEGGPPIGDPPRLAAARRLFARALETPGGLKIQTIHAFCEALLRRFPLEAGVSPGFQVLDDRQAALMLDSLRADLARAAEAGVEDAFDRIARRLNEGAVAEIAAQVLSRRDGFRAADLAPSLAAHFGQVASNEKAALIAASLDRLDWVDLVAHADLLTRLGGKADLALAEALRTAAHQREASPEAAGEALLKALLTKEGNPRSTKGFPAKAVVTADPQALPRREALLAWAEAVSDDLKAAETCARATDLHRFGRALIEAYATAKRARGLLDFDDLIGRAADLLADPDLGPWALYKLDQGIDHVLVDEAQDTSPRQWAVIRALLGDFFAGEGARGVPRTLFVVGDEKQSIYSFQGAEPEAFGAARDWAAARLGDIGAQLERPDLVTSFRSAPGILSFVDAVFADEAGAGLTVEDTPITHLAHRKGDGARVDLWPLIEPPEKPDEPPWENPVDLPPRNNPKSALAEHLAAEIARMIAEETLPARAGEAPRRVTPGDILVLVRKRDRLAQTLIQRLKSLGVPVAGADRLSLAGELAVKDLLALIKAVIQPLDELSLAAVLRSPLCDMDEEALFDLAHGREGTLWQALMAGDAPSPDREMLRDLASRAGFLGPYDFLERVLIRHDGRRRLVARLGLEAEDPLDELLAEALSYEARETPTLSGFVAWIEAGDIQIKREMDQGAGEVRVMTIHGAKGLEAPIVILPDTVHGQSGGGRQVLLEIGGAGNAPAMTLWAGAKPTDDRVTRAAREAAAAKAEAEGRRLLYVGLTRAEDWLILAGAGDETIAEKGWYGQLSKAMGAFETIDILSAAGPIKRVERTAPASPPAAQVEAAPELPAEPPSWVTPAPREARATHLTPSALAPHGAASGAGLGREPALAHGLAVHLLLERLPEIAPDQWRDAAARLGASEAAMAEALACLEAPFAAEVFGPGSLGEVAMAAPLGATSMRGRIDRLVVSPERVLVVDFKSDAAVPADDEGVPQAYLAQLGAYGAALAGVYPDRRIETAILWTRAPRLHGISAAATSAALRAALAEQGIDLPRSDA